MPKQTNFTRVSSSTVTHTGSVIHKVRRCAIESQSLSGAQRQGAWFRMAIDESITNGKKSNKIIDNNAEREREREYPPNGLVLNTMDRINVVRPIQWTVASCHGVNSTMTGIELSRHCVKLIGTTLHFKCLGIRRHGRPMWWHIINGLFRRYTLCKTVCTHINTHVHTFERNNC